MNLDINFELVGKKVRIYSYHSVEDPIDENIDIFVEVDDNKYSGQVYSIKNVERLLGNREFLGYFYDRYGIILKLVDKEHVEEAVRNIILEERISDIFCRQEIDDEL